MLRMICIFEVKCDNVHSKHLLMPIPQQYKGKQITESTYSRPTRGHLGERSYPRGHEPAGIDHYSFDTNLPLNDHRGTPVRLNDMHLNLISFEFNLTSLHIG